LVDSTITQLPRKPPKGIEKVWFLDWIPLNCTEKGEEKGKTSTTQLPS
jgi:hypothetical protein